MTNTTALIDDLKPAPVEVQTAAIGTPTITVEDLTQPAQTALFNIIQRLQEQRDEIRAEQAELDQMDLTEIIN